MSNNEILELSFNKFYKLLQENQSFPEVNETLFEVDSNKITLNCILNKDKVYTHKEFIAHYEIQKNITKLDIVLGYSKLLEGLKCEQSKLINMYKVNLKEKAYLYFTQSDVKSIIGILTFTRNNLDSSIAEIKQQDNYNSTTSGIFVKGKLSIS